MTSSSWAPARPLLVASFAVLVSSVSTSARAQDATEAPANNAEVAGEVATESSSLDQSVVPTYVDDVQRGLRLRVDLGGRYTRIGAPATPIEVEREGNAGPNDDIDVSSVVLFGWDRPFGVPLKLDFFGEGWLDANPDFAHGVGATASTTSYFVDGQSDNFLRDQTGFDYLPRPRLYSAFIGLSANKGDFGGFLEPFSLNIGRQTELVESPITYDGGSVGVDWNAFGLGRVQAKLWGGLDAPQRIVDDPFTRADTRRCVDAYDFDSSATGAVIASSECGNVDPQFNVVAGGRASASFFGANVSAEHASLAVQRTKVGASYTVDMPELLGMGLLARVAGDVRATDFLPRNARLMADASTYDGTTNLSALVKVQFLDDIAGIDATYVALENRQRFDLETAQRIQDLTRTYGIRHLWIPPDAPHVYAFLEGQRLLPLGFSAHARGRVRHHFDPEDLEALRSNLYDGALGLTWSPGMGLETGAELSGGLLDTGNGLGVPVADGRFDLKGEGLQNFAQGRVYTRSTLLDGRMSLLTELFVRRQDIATRAFTAFGQWSGAVAAVGRYDVFDFWSLSGRVDADLLSPFDAVTTTGYIAGYAASTLRF